jgi:hypothetical protein
MRDGLDAPTLQLPVDNVAEVGAFLDGQSLIDLAVWVRHEQQGVEGPLYDHHLMLGIPEDGYETGDPWALEVGIEIPQPGWLDIFPLAEVEALRSFGTVLWERGGGPRGGDPLDYRLTWEPLRLDRDVAAAFARLVRNVGAMSRIEGAVERLWKNGAEVRRSPQLYLEFAERRPYDFERIRSAAREAALEVGGMSAGLPRNPRIRTATLYEASP